MVWQLTRRVIADRPRNANLRREQDVLRVKSHVQADAITPAGLRSVSVSLESGHVSRRIRLEEMLASDPDDPFLHYALALEEVKEDSQIGLRRLESMNEKFPDHVAAYFRRGQILAEAGEVIAATQVLNTGVQVARRIGDDHAVAEMQGLLESL